MKYRFHSQCLDPGGDKMRNGRCWLDVGKICINPEWNFKKSRDVSIGFGVGGGDVERQVGLYTRLPFGFFSLSVDGLFRAKQREVRLSISDGTIHWSLWGDPHSWSTKTPRWKDGWWMPADTFFGKKEYSTKTLKVMVAEIPMPEGVYDATIRLYLATWKRPRWPFDERVFRAEVTPETPIPVPGKGENSWDCGEDAVHSITCVARTPAEAIGEMVESVMNSRLRHGSVSWRPDAAGNMG